MGISVLSSGDSAKNLFLLVSTALDCSFQAEASRAPLSQQPPLLKRLQSHPLCGHFNVLFQKNQAVIAFTVGPVAL